MAFCYELGFGLPTEVLDYQKMRALWADQKEKVVVEIIRYFQSHTLGEVEGLVGEYGEKHREYLGGFQRTEVFAKNAGKWTPEKMLGEYVGYLKRKLYLVVFVGTFEPTYTDKQLDTLKKGKIKLEEFQKKCKPLPLMERGEIPKILLAYISARGDGLKIVFKAKEEWGNLISNQLRMAEYVGCQVDEACKDGSRGQFITYEDDVLLFDMEIMDYHDEGYSAKYTHQYRGGKSQPDLFTAPSPRPSENPRF